MASNEIDYPIYIISKGRSDRSLTAKAFLKNNIPFFIAVEPQEYDLYCQNIPERFVKRLPFQNMGLGSYPARNWCWSDSIKLGFSKHFIFDDNIYGFCKLQNGKRTRCEPRDALVALKNLTLRFKNVAISGFNYRYFVTRETMKPFFINTHVYSAMLIDNTIPHRWRLKYNEDVDLCLQVLHDKYCTILLNAYVVDKVSTTTMMKGGNQTELYQNNDFDKKILKTKSLQMMWPQYVKTGIRFNRPHHYVSWQKHFRHPIIKNT